MKNIRVAIIGAGPAGLSAALWLKNLGAVPVVIEKESITGGMQNFNFLPNGWVLGQKNITGVHVAENFHQHIIDENIDLRLGKYVSDLQRTIDGFSLTLESAESYLDECEKYVCEAVIFANGTRYVGGQIFSRCDGFENIDRQKIIEGPYAFLNIDELNDQNIVIIGAGDNAFENAVMLLERGCSVTVVARSMPKAQAKFIDNVIDHPKFLLIARVDVGQIKFQLALQENTENNGLSLVITGVQSPQNEKTQHIIYADRVHVLAGYQPNTDQMLSVVKQGLAESLNVDSKGYLLVDSFGRTNVSGIYAAGDVCNAQFPCVVSAVASGALAAKTISQDFL